VARLTGLEPATPGVTGRYSNRLSYNRAFTDPAQPGGEAVIYARPGAAVKHLRTAPAAVRRRSTGAGGPRVDAAPRPLYRPAMPIVSDTAPSLEDFEDMAAAAYAELPEAFRARCAGLVVRVADFAEEDMLDELGIEDAFELTGLYEGVSLTDKSVSDVVQMPDAVWLFRRPIMDEWAARGDVALDALVRHVLVHEVAHHFGITDDEIAAIDDWRL
jgi:predicted Zn-dependent protease with MMP-like domain